MNCYIVAFRRHGAWSDVEYTEFLSNSAQEAVDHVRYEMSVYEVVDCFKRVKNWR